MIIKFVHGQLAQNLIRECDICTSKIITWACRILCCMLLKPKPLLQFWKAHLGKTQAKLQDQARPLNPSALKPQISWKPVHWTALIEQFDNNGLLCMKYWQQWLAFLQSNLSLLFFHSDCGLIWPQHSDAKFHGETNGIDCRAIQASILESWIII